MAKKMKELYHYDVCGLDYIYLVNGYKIENDPDYGELVSFEDVKNLHLVIGHHIISNISRLTGQEVRFLRAEMNMSQQNVADLFGVKVGTVNRWEKDKVAIGVAEDKLLRIVYTGHVKKNPNVMKLLSTLDHLQDLKIKKQSYEITESGWELKEAV